MSTKQLKETYLKGKGYYLVDEDVSTSLLCPVDNVLFKQPVIASCGHTFCQPCILGLLDSAENPECPIDKSTLNENSTLIPNLAVEGQIQDLYVHCKHSLKKEGNDVFLDPEGCSKKVRMKDLNAHEESCDYSIITCPNCKEEKLRKKDLEAHRKRCSRCPCPHTEAGCAFFGQGKDLARHLETCPYENIKGYIAVSERKISELKSAITVKDAEFNKLRDSINIMQKQLEQILGAMDTNNATLRFLTSNFEELKIQVTKNDTTLSELQKGTVTRQPLQKILSEKAVVPESKAVVESGKPKNLLAGGHVHGVPGLNVTCIVSFTGHTGPVWALAATEGLLISGSSDTTVKVWELATSTCKLTLTGHEGIVHAVAVHNRHVISGSSDKLIKVWDLDTGKCLRTLNQHENTVCSLVVGGGYIFSGSYSEIKVWNPHTYQEEGTLRGHNHWVRAICIQDRILYSGSHNIIKVWNLDTFQCTGTITAQCGSIYSLAVSENRLLAGTFENLIYLWERDTFRLITTLSGHFGAVYNLCVSGDRLFSASYDTSIRIWSLDTLRCLQTIGHHSSSVEALLLWRGFLFSGSADAAIKMWR